jgi:hypothetical protein
MESYAGVPSGPFGSVSGVKKLALVALELLYIVARL